MNQELKPTVGMLREIKLLNVFSEQELQELLNMGASAQYEPYANIVIEGELSWGLYLILGGSVGVFQTNKMSGNTYDIGQLKAGSFFGEMSLVDDNPRSATVRALTQVFVFYISKESFTNFLNSGDRKVRFFQSCIKTLVNRLRQLNDNYVISQYQLWKTAIRAAGE